MSEVKDGGPAFPTSHQPARQFSYAAPGMTLRDWFTRDGGNG